MKLIVLLLCLSCSAMADDLAIRTRAWGVKHEALWARDEDWCPIVVDMARHWGQTCKVPPELVMAVMLAESHLDPSSRGPCGEKGMGQAMPYTMTAGCLALGLKREPWHPDTQVAVTAWKLARCLEAHPGSLERAVASYNGSWPGSQKYGKRVLAIRKALHPARHVARRVSPDRRNR